MKIAVGQPVVVRPSAVRAEHVVDRDSGLVLRDRRELVSGRHIAGGPDAVRGGAEPVVHHDPTALVLDPGPVELELLDVRCAPGCQQDLLDLELVSTDGRDDRAALAPDPLDGRPGPDVDVFVLERGRQLGDRVRVRSRGKAVGCLDDGHLRAEAREDLRQLEADGPAADDQQRLGELGQLERRDVVEPAGLVQALDRRHSRARPGRDQDALGRQPSPVHLDRLRVDERARPVEGRVARAVQPLHPGLAGDDQRVLPRLHLRQIGAGRPDLDAERLCQRLDVMGELGGDQVRLRGLAGDVGAASAPARVLDQRHACAVLLRRLVGAVPGTRPRAEDDQVELLAHCMPPR